jgi:tRNA-specific 2-thiouridylase
LRTRGLLLKNTNWLGDGRLEEAAADGLPIHVRIRSSQAPQPATLFSEAEGTARVVLRNGEDGVAVGQACVFYADGDSEARLLGGGFIAHTLARQSAAAEEAAPTLS